MFGDGKTHYPISTVILPMMLGTSDILYEKASVISGDLPLLMGRQMLKSGNAKIDVENDRMTIYGQNVKLRINSEGHYAINIAPTDCRATDAGIGILAYC